LQKYDLETFSIGKVEDKG